jgi:HAD domain in Swiss Army Knife RNA repair proteins
MTIDDLQTSEGWCRATGEKALDSQVQAFKRAARSPSEDPWLQLYLANGREILEVAACTLGSLDKAVDWFRHATLPQFGNATPRALLSLGRTAQVLEALRVVQIGSQRAALENRPHRSERPVLFLDFDDVICLHADGVFGMVQELYREDARLEAILDVHKPLWSTLFDPHAVGYLRSVQDEFRPQIVLTTSWRRLFSENALASILDLCGLDFVIENLHQDGQMKWRPRASTRWLEIQDWLGEHPDYRDNFVILDDTLSGATLVEALQVLPTEELRDLYDPYLVLCKKDKGLTTFEFHMLRNAFLTRRVVHERELKEAQLQWMALENDLVERAGRAAPLGHEDASGEPCP